MSNSFPLISYFILMGAALVYAVYLCVGCIRGVMTEKNESM